MDLDGLIGSLRTARSRPVASPRPGLPPTGPAGLEAALDRLATEAIDAAHAGIEVLILSDRSFGADELPIPSILAVGAVHTALTTAGLRGRTDILVEASTFSMSMRWRWSSPLAPRPSTRG